jgi:long-subunit fatty acid transport protein
MKKLFVVAAAVMFSVSMFAGGLVTNTNQSAAWVRLPARDASTQIDAVYFNPAGLMKLNNGLHFSLSNQTIFQNREVISDYPYLNDGTYEGKVTAPIFPSIYAAYKMDKLAFSFGFNAIGGGGGATYDRGLPSFELSPSDLVPSLASQGVSEYRLDAFFEGTSVFFGYQAGISYKINEMISVFAGARYVTAKNTYNGYLRNIEINPGGNWVRADAFFANIASQLTSITQIPANLNPLIIGGGGSLTLTQAQSMGLIDAAARQGIEAGLSTIGVDPAMIDAMDIIDIQATLISATPALEQQIATYTGTSTLLQDKEADVEQTASGITPIIGINISPSENLNIGLKYEFATELEFTNNTTSDILMGFDETGNPVTMFPDEAKFRGDMPAMLSAGIDYKATENLRVSIGTHYYFDKGANYGKKIGSEYVSNEDVIDNNFFEVAGGLEYGITDKLLISGGYLLAKTGVNENYQSDLSYSLTSSTIGAGGAYKFSDNLMLNLGVGYTIYQDGEKTFNHLLGENVIPVTETYKKDNLFIAVGIDFSF